MGPVDAIADMLAPVVLISAAGIFANGLLNADTASGARLHELNGERLSILTGPSGEILPDDQVTDMSRVRLDVIDHQVPLVISRIRSIRNACVLCYIAMGLLVLSIILIAASIPGHSQATGYTALALVVCGVIVQFTAVVLVTRVMISSVNTLAYEPRRSNKLGLDRPEPVLMAAFTTSRCCWL